MSRYENLIDGLWVGSQQLEPNLNPANTDDVIGEYAQATSEHVASAIGAARRALGQWSGARLQLRADVLFRVSEELFARKDELGLQLSREEGKTRSEAAGEVARAAHVFRFFAGEALRIGAERIASVRPNVDVEIGREAVGVVGVITPWNFPIAIPAWKIAAALAYGNTVVFKPSELTPASAWSLAEMISKSGAPSGVFNLVMGGAAVGQAMLDGDIDAVTFTGSVATGRKVIEAASRRLIKIQAEMGGKNPLVILDDADLEVAVQCAVDGSFYQTGQRCTASSRLIVTDQIHDRFVEAVADRVQKLVIGDPAKTSTQLGPVVDQRQLAQDLRYMAIGLEEGAVAKVKGAQVDESAPGFYLTPTLFVETTNSMRINREEIFGPIAAVIRVKDYDEALQVANDTPYGLSSGICTASQKYARHFQLNSQSGLTMLNLPTAGLDYHVPFGGSKASSYGPREQGKAAVEFYTTTKTSYLAV